VTEVEYLTLEDLLGFVRRLGLGPVRDLGLLDAAITRPQSSAFGEDAYPTVKLKAAALLQSIVSNHSLVDGNKRLGWLATTVFLDLNGEPVDLEDDDAFQLVVEVAEGRMGVEEIADRFMAG
jgi:death-on-curing protein